MVDIPLAVPSHAESDPPGTTSGAEGKRGADGFNAGFTGTVRGGGTVLIRGYVDGVGANVVRNAPIRGATLRRPCNNEL